MNARRKNLTELGRLSSKVWRARVRRRETRLRTSRRRSDFRPLAAIRKRSSLGAERQAPAINASSFGALVLGLRLSNPAEFRRVSRRLRRRSSAKNLSLPVEDFSLVSALPNELCACNDRLFRFRLDVTQPRLNTREERTGTKIRKKARPLKGTRPGFTGSRVRIGVLRRPACLISLSQSQNLGFRLVRERKLTP